MSEVTAENALVLREAILDHDTWNESMPELAGFDREGFVAIDGDRVRRDQLPAATLNRLGVIATDPDDESKYEISFGRRINRRFKTLSDMYAAWPDDQQWDPSYVYDDYGPEAAYIRIVRSKIEDNNVTALLAAYYTISAQESREPGQPPLCDVKVDVEDRLPRRQLVIELGEKGGSLLDVAQAMGVDPLTGERDPDKPEMFSDIDFKINLANELGNPLSEEEIAELQAAEAELHPLTSTEIIGLAALARSVETSIQI